MKAQPHGTVITTAKILSKKRNAIAAFVRAVARAEKLIHTDPTKTEELFKSYQPSLDAKTVQALMPVLRKEIPAVPVLTKDGYAKTLHFHQVAGLAKNAPDYATMTDNNFAAKAISAKG
jgi:ABC-type nitrate/sulfonate/bicarbonate transport system substrate-binding protein